MNSAQTGAHFPVQHRSLSLDIKGNKTDIVISKYEDTFLVIVTQIGCMGSILAAKYAFYPCANSFSCTCEIQFCYLHYQFRIK